jgi:predicted CXXCH cytochrome family protein
VKWRGAVAGCIGAGLMAGLGYAGWAVHRGFSASDEPAWAEKTLARAVRHLSIPRRARREANPLRATPENLEEGREDFLARCANCHGTDGRGRTSVGRNLYPKPPDLTGPETQELSDGEIHYIIEHGVRLTGMPAWGSPPHRTAAGSTEFSLDAAEGWKLTLYIRSLREPRETEKARTASALASAHYTGSAACAKCHAEIYERWKKTPMASVVRDPREHPDAIIPDLATNTVAKFKREDVAFVYGSIWKQRYFQKVGDDYFPLGAQWDVVNKVWKPYHVGKGTDWWEPFYPEENAKRPTGPTCDGCHSVDYNISTKQVAEWNVGCERCHGPGSEHAAHPAAWNIANPARMDYVSANDTCIQCHSQGRPLKNPIGENGGRYYDWPVGYRVGLRLADFWQLEEHKLGETTFTHFADGTAHKNRMQGNDFVQSVMYRRGVTCFDCHDVHGTANYAQLRTTSDKLCLECHGPLSPNGPRTPTLAEHTHHKDGSPGSSCVACHMPKIETTLGNIKVRAHTFAFISPAETLQYGIPNPCTECHTDKSAAWALEAMRHWPERSPWRLGTLFRETTPTSPGM